LVVKDWRAIAKASGLELPARDLDRIAQPLDSLEATFRPLVEHLVPEDEPSFSFQPEENE
jgi:hypothetical protein